MLNVQLHTNSLHGVLHSCASLPPSLSPHTHTRARARIAPHTHTHVHVHALQEIQQLQAKLAEANQGLVDAKAAAPAPLAPRGRAVAASGDAAAAPRHEHWLKDVSDYIRFEATPGEVTLMQRVRSWLNTFGYSATHNAMDKLLKVGVEFPMECARENGGCIVPPRCLQGVTEVEITYGKNAEDSSKHMKKTFPAKAEGMTISCSTRNFEGRDPSPGLCAALQGTCRLVVWPHTHTCLLQHWFLTHQCRLSVLGAGDPKRCWVNCANK